MKTNIALTGFMGAGKSTIALLLAERLSKQAVELDKLIETNSGKSIADIFSDEGEDAFRRLEIELTKEIAANENQVISCGGGIILNKINITIYLKAAPEVLHNRIVNKKIDRPLLKDDDSLQTVKNMMLVRQPLYESTADIIIDTSEMNTEETVSLIIERLKDYEGFN